MNPIAALGRSPFRRNQVSSAAYRWRFVEIGLVVENVLNSTWREAQFASTSYVVGRDDPRYAVSGREDVHFTPGNPIGIRATVGAYF